MIKINSVTDTDNEFNECVIPKKRYRSITVLPFSLHAFMNTLDNNISKTYQVQVDCLKDSKPNSYDRNYIK